VSNSAVIEVAIAVVWDVICVLLSSRRAAEEARLQAA
jgi:hypothetical protein